LDVGRAPESGRGERCRPAIGIDLGIDLEKDRAAFPRECGELCERFLELRFAVRDRAAGDVREALAGGKRAPQDERDRERTLKRGGRQPPTTLDVETAEGRYQLEPRDDLTPEKLFDRRWALTLLERVLAHVRADQMSAGKTELFDYLKGFLTGDNAGAPYAEIAETLGMTEGAVKVAVHRLRRHFRDTLVREIAETVSDPADIDAEIQRFRQRRILVSHMVRDMVQVLADNSLRNADVFGVRTVVKQQIGAQIFLLALAVVALAARRRICGHDAVADAEAFDLISHGHNVARQLMPEQRRGSDHPRMVSAAKHFNVGSTDERRAYAY